MKGCEPRDILDRATDICKFENTRYKVDAAYRRHRVAQLLWYVALVCAAGAGCEESIAIGSIGTLIL
jgi:hypothetical protein